TANAGTADENVNVREATSNTVDVRVWNRGGCSLPATTTYSVCLGWSPPSASIPFPLPPSPTIPCKTETVPAGGWPPGTSRTTTFNWTPAANSLPAGHACLVAWSSITGDLPLNTASVVLDNNRAQRNIAFVTLAQSSSTSATGLW